MNNDAPPPAPPRKRGCLRLFLWTSVGGLIFLISAGYIAKHQIGDALARNLDQRLSSAGVYISWKSAAWIPGPGIRLREVEVFRDAAKKDRFVLLSNVSATKAEPGWERWDTFKVQTDRAKLVVDRGRNETAMTDLHLDLVVQPGKLDLQACNGDLLGLHIEAEGDYLITPKPQSSESVPAPQSKGEDGLLGDINLDWLATVKEWVKIDADKEPPTLHVAFHSIPESGALGVAAHLDGKSFRWRGQNWDSIGASIKGAFGENPSPIAIEKIEIGHGGKTAVVAATADLKANVVQVSKFDSTLDLLALARAFAPEAAASLKPVTTTGAWHIAGTGSIRTDQPTFSKWNGTVALAGGLNYAEGTTQVTLQNPGFGIDLENGVMKVANFKSGIWDGQLLLPQTTVRLGDASTKPTFETQASLSDARLEAISKSFGSGAAQPGVLHADWRGGGEFDLPAIAGSGTLSVHQAEFFRIPLLGPLHLVFDKLTPGFGKDVASDLTANHSLSKGILSIRDLKLESKLTRIEAQGDADLVRSYAKLTAKAKLQGIAGLTTALLSALLEVEGEGPFSDMKWGLKNLSGTELVKGAAEMVGKTGGAVLEGGETAVKATTDAATGTVKEAGKAVKGILKLPGKFLPGKK